ncbi:MAG TPA: Gfo/Idh/MocA family oxidoreductase [Candidatus Angelobacter sp.]|nr:Gfo/Idh/MocA family oxidoreductase [Candidatus Angelobacter sp.]
MTTLRWGILSTANIARKNWKGIWHSGNSIVTAVASRDAARSRKFVAECQQEKAFPTAPAAFGSYEQLLRSPDVDAVYIPIPTGIRKEWVIRAAEAGKHILCEKPAAANVADLREMIAACERNKVQFMDGVMFMHNPRLERIRDALDDENSFGTVRRITSHFSFLGNEDFLKTNVRSHSVLEPLGCLGDLGWYCIRFTLWAMNWKLPREARGLILSQACCDASQEKVPFTFSGELVFDDEISAGFYCSFLATYTNWAVATGTKGTVRVPDFVLPQRSSEGALDINGMVCDNLVMDPIVAQETRMVRAFTEQVLSGKLNPGWPECALRTQIVTNACLESAREGRPVMMK